MILVPVRKTTTPTPRGKHIHTCKKAHRPTNHFYPVQVLDSFLHCSVVLEIPFLTTHWAKWSFSVTFGPFLDAMNVKGVQAFSCYDGAIVPGGFALGTARVEQMPANSTRIALDIPRPCRHQVNGAKCHFRRGLSHARGEAG